MKGIAYVTELLYALLLAPFAHVMRLIGWRPQRVTIVGWWGSETVGDIAILGQLLRELDGLTPLSNVRVVSFDASLTRRSLRQLERSQVAVVPLGVLSAVALVTSRAVIFGGGPLMESPSMRFWAWCAGIARFTGANVMLYANGIGPLRSTRATEAVRALVQRASHCVFRDKAALAWAVNECKRQDAVLSFDPAFDFVRSEISIGHQQEPQIALALRTPPANYLGSPDVHAATERFVSTVAQALDAVAEQRDVKFVGIVMHTGYADSDDHRVYQLLRAKMKHAERLHVLAGVHTIAQTVQTLESSRAALTVRFHAMIFALATETPFVAVDYARPDGKVSAAASDVDRSEDVVLWDSLSAADLSARLLRAYDKPNAPAPDLRSAANTRRAVLRAVVS